MSYFSFLPFLTFKSGFIQLKIHQVSLVAELGRGVVIRSGKIEKLRLLAIVIQATGDYSAVAGSVGTARFQLTSVTPKPVRGLPASAQKWYPKTVEFTIALANLNVKADEALLQP
jgi:hypothetical protein